MSGLLGDLSLLLHDAPLGGEVASTETSLVLARDGRAIAGPRAREGDRLRPVPGVSIVRWRDWLAEHPDSTVVVREPGSMRRYRRISYERYLDGDKWIVEPRALPAESLRLAPRDRVVSVLDPTTGALLAVLPVEELREVAFRDRAEVTIADRKLVLQPDPSLDALLVVDAAGLVTRPGMWIGTWLADPTAAEAALATGRAGIAR